MGQVCSNDSDFNFPLDNLEKDQNCAWITKNYKKKTARINRYCAKADIADACPASCGKCPTEGICLGDCQGTGTDKECTFTMKIDIHAGELGYYTVEECGDEPNPTLGIVKGATYLFNQEVSLPKTWSTEGARGGTSMNQIIAFFTALFSTPTNTNIYLT